MQHTTERNTVLQFDDKQTLTKVVFNSGEVHIHDGWNTILRKEYPNGDVDHFENNRIARRTHTMTHVDGYVSRLVTLFDDDGTRYMTSVENGVELNYDDDGECIESIAVPLHGTFFCDTRNGEHQERLCRFAASNGDEFEFTGGRGAETTTSMYLANQGIRIHGRRCRMHARHHEVVKHMWKILACRDLSVPKVEHEKGQESCTECVICLSETRTHCVIPCGHWCLCTDCASADFSECPLCRGPFSSVQRIWA